METQYCSVIPTEDGFDIYPSTQWMDISQAAAAAALNIPANRYSDIFALSVYTIKNFFKESTYM